MYDLASCTVPMAVYYGDKDVLATPALVERMMSRYGNVVSKRKLKGYGHMDFIWGSHMVDLNREIVSIISAKVGQSRNLENQSQTGSPLPSIDDTDDDDNDDNDDNTSDEDHDQDVSPEATFDATSAQID
jgi:hypothetical protein